MQRIDFQGSDIRWVTTEEKSRGVFQVESVLRLWECAAVEPKWYALGAAVLAGNMYVDGGLCKDPPYMFQLAAGLSDHAIFRTALSHQRRGSGGKAKSTQVVQDTFGTNRQIFDAIDINIATEPGLPLQGYKEIESHFSRGGRFTGLVTIDLAAAGKIEMEFPVKHLNLLPSCKQWQLESGPVRFLKQGEPVALSGEFITDLLPCFVHANRFDCAEFYPDFPFASGARTRSVTAKKGKVCCQVQLLVGDN